MRFISIFVLLSLFIILGYVIFIYSNTQPKCGTMNHKEGFIPAIDKIYRPHIRNARAYGKKVIDHFTNYTYVFSKKRGLA